MKSMNLGSKILLSVTLLASSTSFTACKSSDVANALGTAAIIGGAVVIANNTRCEGGYVERCHYFNDYYGHSVRECRQSYDDCAYLVPKSLKGLSDAEMQTVVDNADLAVTDVNWGQAFGIGFDASQTFIDAMKSARDGHKDSLTALGMSDDDINKLTQSKMISDSGVDALSQNLNVQKANANFMLREIIRVTQERADAQRQAQEAQASQDAWNRSIIPGFNF